MAFDAKPFALFPLSVVGLVVPVVPDVPLVVVELLLDGVVTVLVTTLVTVLVGVGFRLVE